MYVTIIDYSSSYDIFVSTTSVQEERSVKLQLTTPTVIGHAFRHPQKMGVIKNTTPFMRVVFCSLLLQCVQNTPPSGWCFEGDVLLRIASMIDAFFHPLVVVNFLALS